MSEGSSAIQLPTRARRLRRLGLLAAVFAAYVGVTFALAWRYSAHPGRRADRVDVRGGWFYRDGEKLLINAVGYDPARPGELPWARERSRDLLDDDLAAIRAAGFDALRTWEPLTRDDLAAAQRHGLGVVQGVWVDPEGDFADPAFRAAAVARASEAARAVSGHRATLAWLVMNEPRPEAVLRAGLGPTRELLRALADAVRAADPGVPVGFASWPGLEMLDEPSMDFVAANLYPFRPGRLLESVGYAGMVGLWRRELAGGRPLLVSEYGLSVSPGLVAPDAPGGRTEEEQAVELPRLADDAARAGAAGTAAFMWIDGWWKNNEAEGDEATHDPDDGEEWFGLVAMDTLTDDAGRPRPVLATMAARNQAILTLPLDGPAPAREVEIEARVRGEGPYTLAMSIDGGAATVVPAVRDGEWLRGRAGLLADVATPQRLRISIRGPEGFHADFDRVVLPPGAAPSVAIDATRTGDAWQLRVTARDPAGAPLVGAPVRVSLSEPTRLHDRAEALLTDAAGEARLEVPVPPEVVLLATAALRDGEDPPLALDARVLGVEGR
jgi:hypothetical protein